MHKVCTCPARLRKCYKFLHINLLSELTPLSVHLRSESLKKEEPIGAVTEAVAESLKEAVGKEVKRRIGEAVALYLFDQWWDKAEEKYNAVKERKLSLRKVGEESNRICHVCKFTALSENNLTEHLMINHVFDLNLSQ